MAFSDEQLGKLLLDIATVNNHLSSVDNLKNMSGDTLSYTGLKLAAMKASVVDLKVDAQRDMLDKEVEKDRAKAQAYYTYKQEHGSTAAGDMKYMDENFIEKTKEYNEAKVQYEKLKTILSDTHDTIESARSRVIELQGQRKNERT